MSDERQGPSESVSSAEQVEVAYANNSVQAAMIQVLLESGGIPSVLQALGVTARSSASEPWRPALSG